MTLVRVRLPCPNYSSRGGATVRLVVLHTTEGATTYQSLGAYFNGTAGTANPVSSHVGIDDTPNTVGEYVARSSKAWTQGDANPVAVAAELCAFAKWDASTWAQHPTMLANAAQWVAEECAAFGIPIVRLGAAQAQDGRSRGVTDHYCLGEWGGNHWDCGPGFEAPGGPFDQIIARAGGGPAPGPVEEEGPTMWLLQDPESGGWWELAQDGGIFAYDGAPYLGGPNNATQNPAGWKPAGLAAFSDRSGPGYCVTLDAGSAGGDRFRRYRYPRDGSARV